MALAAEKARAMGISVSGIYPTWQENTGPAATEMVAISSLIGWATVYISLRLICRGWWWSIPVLLRTAVAWILDRNKSCFCRERRWLLEQLETRNLQTLGISKLM
ncbi:hypothetical protein DUNSADRAFT_2444 [Dunaliella salina]|uniref:Uncharacterized protein n=1 Tax=Dunaliella salina TaxID=3046 RepID=A0ABQ7FWA2_DUNSA|nr:hypothetical protein DUNSADRAFT_2444 [Dunaliella salina]|eukprot:KAF5826653.1 hypothetical protein DUNSADRAFT_2444 [Dunaliella salina]